MDIFGSILPFHALTKAFCQCYQQQIEINNMLGGNGVDIFYSFTAMTKLLQVNALGQEQQRAFC